MRSFQETSYQLHSQAYTETDDESKRIQQTWLDESTVDFWRHFRMLQPLTHLLKHYPHSKCVTIGDGRFGLDSIKLKKIEPSLHILPTDIAPYLLQLAREQKVINDFRIENAEQLSFQENQFDFSFCVESYHHFPRPYIALYEMIRVSRKGIVLIEPNDIYPKPILRRLYDVLRMHANNWAGKNRGRKHPEHLHFEESGNYVFTLSKREIEKIAIGLQLPVVAFYYFNDYYEKGVEFEKLNSHSNLFKKIKWKIKLSNLKCQLGLSSYGNIIAILFKERPADNVSLALEKTGFEVIELPANPHLNSNSIDQLRQIEVA